MKKTFWKNSIKSIRGNISRFIAMLSIILLSSGVITGLLVSAPNMEMSMTDEYNKYSTTDFQLISDIGFDDDSYNIVSEYSSDYDIQMLNMFDKSITVNNSILISSILYELDLNNIKVNDLEIIEGNLPKTETEILAERSSYYIEELEVGDKVTIDSKEYSISGIVANSWYFSKEAERGITTSNPVKGIFYKNFEPTNNSYTNMFLTINNKSNTLNQFSKSYINLIKDHTLDLDNNIIDKLIEKRAENIYKETAYKINTEEVNLYTFNRSSNLSYQTFKTFVSKVSKITQIFPVFFLIVSILVVLTTMTRMIEEERQEIGVLRSLGYSKKTIYNKYLMYALFIGIVGAGVGYATGFRLIPSIINDAFTSVFYMPPLNLNIFSFSNILYLIFIVLSILITTIFAIKKTLKLNVASLLLPKAPKLGKRIFLEKINFIWKRLKFKYKSSLRNLFRYPNHFIMTVVGIAGSLSLVFTGLALTTSITAVTDIQYKEINNYNFSVDIKATNQNFNDFLDSNYQQHIYLFETNYMVTTKKTDENIYVNVIVTDENINDYITLRTRKGKKTLKLTNDGVVISEQLANYMELKVDDIFEATKTDHLKITGITENYLNNYVYMTKTYYETNFNTEAVYNKLLIKSDKTNNELITEEFLEFDNVLNTNFLTDEILAKERLLNQVSILAIVIVLAACFLAVVIIYNLTNVNISEREKELSTLKVLGYKNTEVSNYIFREINIMTVIAILLGTPLGFILHRFVIFSIEEPNMMMGRNIKWYTVIISIALTVVITFLVELIMSFKIKKIDMIGALKEL